MLCGITLFIKNIPFELKEYHLRTFKYGSHFDLSTGIEIPIPSRKSDNNNSDKMIWRRAIYKNLELLLGVKYDPLTKKNYWHLKVKGSIHKYYHDGENLAFFSANDAERAIDCLCKELKIQKSKARITNIEIGVNIPVWFKVADYYKRNLQQYKLKFFEPMKSQSRCKNSIGWEVEQTHYTVQIYAKSEYLLRFEVRYTDMQELRERYSLFTADDISADLINTIGEKCLLPKWNEIISRNGLFIVEGYTPSGLSRNQVKILRNFSNKAYVEELDSHIVNAKLKGDKKEEGRLRKVSLRGRACLIKIITSHPESDQTHEMIYDLISKVIYESKKMCLLPEIGVNIRKWTIDESLNSSSEIISSDCNLKSEKMNHIQLNQKTKLCKVKSCKTIIRWKKKSLEKI